jgi:hypothetical protein
MRNRMRHCDARLVVLCLMFGQAIPAMAQALSRGEGIISQTYQSEFGGDHLDSFGNVANFGPMRATVLSMGITYGVTDRLTVGAEIPYVFSKFTSTPGRALTAHDLEAKLDDGRYHGTLQDFRGSIRYQVVRDAIRLTPFFEVILPMRAYETFGHAAPGRHLREYRFGTNATRLLDPLHAYVDVQPVYAHVESLAGLNLDHANVDLEVGYFLTPRVTIRGFGGMQKTRGGVEAPTPPSSPYFEIHDRALRTHYSRAGAGVILPVASNKDVSASYITLLSAKNSHAFSTFSIGINWTFQTRR